MTRIQLGSRKALLWTLLIPLNAALMGNEGCPSGTDADGDGYPVEQGDCNDQDPSIYPGAAEVCDGIDNDCDGRIDDGVPVTSWFQDLDGDGFGDQSTEELSCAPLEGYVSRGGDCDDTDPEVSPAALEVCDFIDNDCNGVADDAPDSPMWYPDRDGDGVGTSEGAVQNCARPNGYAATDGDCNDKNPSVNPGAEDVCDGLDNNCDGTVDENGGPQIWYADADGDGYGNPDRSLTACSAPSGYVAQAGDCNDNAPNINPAAEDICDAKDNNCDGIIDENGGPQTWYPDADGDGYGGPRPLVSCTRPTGYVSAGGDCDDAHADVNPGVEEVCDGIDNNCDGDIDFGQTAITFYRDEDGDGYGAPQPTVVACEAPSGYVAVSGDCNDRDVSMNPSAPEICDAKDNNCNGSIDEGFEMYTWYPDGDGDGFGVTRETILACIQPEGYAPQTNDCNDLDPEVNPGAAEICDNKDNDCDGAIDDGLIVDWYVDRDGDGYGTSVASIRSCDPPDGFSALSGDCDDADPDANPGLEEICDGKDNNCDAAVDEGFEADLILWYLDADGDGHGTDEETLTSCTQPEGYSSTADDCDDRSEETYPGAVEICDQQDNSCDGFVDEGLEQSIWYPDLDEDGYGTPKWYVMSCSAPNSHVDNADDCDDADATTFPGASETCDGKDNDCNAAVDDNPVDPVAFYADVDADGHGNATVMSLACAAPAGFVTDATDCNDQDATIFPSAEEVCDQQDNDCDGFADEDLERFVWYEDFDEDGFGSALVFTESCGQPAGFVADASDCNDQDPGVYPGAPERYNQVDDDCNGEVDDGIVDVDGDGVSLPAGDCNDFDPTIYPGAQELCNGIDEDCNGQADDGVLVRFFRDADTDGYGNPQASVTACSAPAGYVTDASDCDDANAAIYPTASERCNAVDDNCDGSIDEGFASSDEYPTLFIDQDFDGFGVKPTAIVDCVPLDAFVLTRGDCNDANAMVHPGAVDAAGDSVDSDCGGDDAPQPHVGFGPASFATIGGALAAAAAGHTVWVAPGSYTEHDLGFAGKAVKLMSTDFASETVIDAARAGVVFSIAALETAETVIDGFTITGGSGINGGGIYIEAANPTIKSCLITGNFADAKGGGIYLGHSKSVISGTVFRSNSTISSAGQGGAIYFAESDAQIVNSTFDHNSSVTGGALYLYYGLPIFKNVHFIYNTASSRGGGIYSNYSTPTMANVSFIRNSATVEAGGVYFYSKRPIMKNTLFERNSSAKGGAMYLYYASPTINNMSVVNNTATTLGGGLYLFGAQAKPLIYSSAMTHNDSYNLYLDAAAGIPVPTVLNCDLYNPSGVNNHNLPTVDASNLLVEPQYLAYDSTGRPFDFHLALTSPLVNKGNTAYKDYDGSAGDIGMYGSTNGYGWDMDLDGWVDYFWPGTIDDAPVGFSSLGFDLDDQDPTIH